MSSAKPFFPLTTRQLRCSWCCLCLPLLAVVTVAREEDGHLPGKDDDIDPRVFEVEEDEAAFDVATPAARFLAQKPPRWPLALGENALSGIEFPSEWPWREGDVRRQDEADDSIFYKQPRMVTHISDAAIASLTDWYDKNLPKGEHAAVLDVCSSWVSHLPRALEAHRIVGLGMNQKELLHNERLSDLVVQDLNKNPELPFDDASFDAIINAVSVDYLTKPLEVFQEFHRIAAPDALVAMSFSNRMFWVKAIERWRQASEFQRLLICASYFHFAGFTNIRAERINNYSGGDPMYVVFARVSKKLDLGMHTDL